MKKRKTRDYSKKYIWITIIEIRMNWIPSRVAYKTGFHFPVQVRLFVYETSSRKSNESSLSRASVLLEKKAEFLSRLFYFISLFFFNFCFVPFENASLMVILLIIWAQTWVVILTLTYHAKGARISREKRSHQRQIRNPYLEWLILCHFNYVLEINVRGFDHSFSRRAR